MSFAVVLVILAVVNVLALTLGGGKSAGPGSWPQTAAFSADSKYLVTAGLTEAQVIDPGTGRVLARWHPEPRRFPQLDSIAISADDKTIVTAALGDVRRWSLHDVLAAGVGGSPRPLSTATAPYPKNAVGHAALSADGKLLVLPSRHGGVVVWSTATGRVRDRIGDLDGGSFSYVSPDDRVLAGHDSRNELALWDISGSSPRLVRVDPNAGFVPVFTPGDGLVKTLSASHGSTRLVDDATGKQLARLPSDGDPGGNLDQIAYSPAAGLLARLSFSSGRVTVWSLASGRVVARPMPPASAFSGKVVLASGESLAFSPNGKTLAVLPGSGPAWLWHVPRSVLRSGGGRVRGGTIAERP